MTTCRLGAVKAGGRGGRRTVIPGSFESVRGPARPARRDRASLLAPVATAATVATAASRTPATPFGPGPGLVDRKGPTAAFLAVQGGDGGQGLLVVLHLDEAEALGAARVPVHD